jgi:glycosyltransferase involved in cell wall biosynthesis
MIKQPLNILFMNSIAGTVWGGGENWMVRAAVELSRRGHQVTVGCRRGSLLMNRAEQAGLITAPLGIRIDFDPLKVGQIARFLRKNHTDILICNFMKDIRCAGLAGRMVSVPVILARQGLVLFKNRWKYRIAIQRLTDGILTNSGSIKQTYLEYGWMHPSEIHVIHNGVARGVPDPGFDLIARYPAAENKWVILSAGRLDPQKGFQDLIEVARIAHYRNQPWMFLVAGDGPLHEPLQRRIDRLKLQDTIRLIGFQAGLTSLMRACDVFALPSRFEGMPNVVLEAMIEGKPVVATRINGVEELIEEGFTGALAEPQNPEHFFSVLLDLFQHPERQQSMGKAGQVRIRQHFSCKKMGDQLEALFYRLRNR